MQIEYHKNFDKRFNKLNAKLKDKVIKTVTQFTENPFDPRLKNHAFKGDMEKWRAISVTGDVRIVFQEYDGYVFWYSFLMWERIIKYTEAVFNKNVIFIHVWSS